MTKEGELLLKNIKESQEREMRELKRLINKYPYTAQKCIDEYDKKYIKVKQ